MTKQGPLAPLSDVIAQIAADLGVPEDKRRGFAAELTTAVDHVRQFQPLQDAGTLVAPRRAPVSKLLRGVRGNIGAILEALAQNDPDGRYAQSMLNVLLSQASEEGLTVEGTVLLRKEREIGDFVGALEELDAFCLLAEQLTQKTLRPKPREGVGRNPVLNSFFQFVWGAARHAGMDWTLTRPKPAKPTSSGSFIDACRALEPYLPNDFLPKADFGEMAWEVRKKLPKARTGKREEGKVQPKKAG